MSREDGGQVRVVVRETCPFKLTEPGVRFQIRGDAPESRFGFVWRGGKTELQKKKRGSKSLVPVVAAGNGKFLR